MTEVNANHQGLTPELLLAAYRSALKRYESPRLLEIAQQLSLLDSKKATRVPERIAEYWSEDPKVTERRLASLPEPSKQALTLFALLEANTLPAQDLIRALKLMGVPVSEALEPLLSFAILVVDPGTVEGAGVFAPEHYLRSVGIAYQLRIHPTIPGVCRTVLPSIELPLIEESVRRIRQCDALEIVLRLAGVWQRVSEAPLRRTQQGAFFKRDRERLEDDPAIAGPITDAIEPLPDMAMLWVALAEAVGLLFPEADTDRIVASKPEYWSDNAVHLPQMVANRWLGLTTWHEVGGSRLESSGPELTTLSLRLPLLLLLAKAGGDGWVATSELVGLLDQNRPGWESELWPIAAPNPEQKIGDTLVDAILLGPGYQLGLVQTAEETNTGRRLVRLSELGRYSLAVGSPPQAAPAFEHFLYVQPNFEIIAYRQGLTPSIIGRFSRFARWSKLGAAIELKLTSDSVYRGLEGGMTPDDMLMLLRKHSSRPLPASVEDSVRTWSGRRERVTYHASATLIEFATADELELALTDWPTGRETPIRVSPRLLLVDDVSSIPFQRFRQAGARDYRRPSEPCVEVAQDGVTLTIDLGQSDLLVDAEIIRFADEQPQGRDAYSARRRFLVSRESLARGIDAGLTSAQLAKWFLQRAGVAMPASVRLMLHAVLPGSEPIGVGQPRVLAAPSEELLDGLLQHPATRDAFAERLGPRHAILYESAWPALELSVKELGLTLTLGYDSSSEVSARGMSATEGNARKFREGGRGIDHS